MYLLGRILCNSDLIRKPTGQVRKRHDDNERTSMGSNCERGRDLESKTRDGIGHEQYENEAEVDQH